MNKYNPPPLSIKKNNNKQTKKPFCKDMENVLRQHIMYVKLKRYIGQRHGT